MHRNQRRTVLTVSMSARFHTGDGDRLYYAALSKCARVVPTKSQTSPHRKRSRPSTHLSVAPLFTKALYPLIPLILLPSCSFPIGDQRRTSLISHLRLFTQTSSGYLGHSPMQFIFSILDTPAEIANQLHLKTGLLFAPTPAKKLDTVLCNA
jgi:hypothetical protein